MLSTGNRLVAITRQTPTLQAHRRKWGLVSLLKYNYFVVSVCKMSLEDRYLILEKKRNSFYLCMYERPD